MSEIFDALSRDGDPYYAGARRIPEHLFRYRGANSKYFDEEMKRLLLSHEIYCAPIDGQNDPFDCKPILAESPLREVNQLLKAVNRTRTTASPEDLAKITGVRERKKFEKRMRPGPVAARSMIENKSQQYSQYRDKTCIACFAEVWDSILMWSHYTNSHSGLCIQFEFRDPKGLPEITPPQPVLYTATRTILTTIDLINLSRASPFASEEVMKAAKKCTDALLYEKSKEWSYEKEWRISAQFGGRGYKSVEFLEPVGVIFGLNATEETINTVRKYAPSKTKLSRIAMHETEYRLVAHPLVGPV